VCRETGGGVFPACKIRKNIELLRRGKSGRTSTTGMPWIENGLLTLGHTICSHRSVYVSGRHASTTHGVHKVWTTDECELHFANEREFRMPVCGQLLLSGYWGEGRHAIGQSTMLLGRVRRARARIRRIRARRARDRVARKGRSRDRKSAAVKGGG
jgi:hypothetical protein